MDYFETLLDKIVQLLNIVEFHSHVSVDSFQTDRQALILPLVKRYQLWFILNHHIHESFHILPYLFHYLFFIFLFFNILLHYLLCLFYYFFHWLLTLHFQFFFLGLLKNLQFLLLTRLQNVEIIKDVESFHESGVLDFRVAASELVAEKEQQYVVMVANHCL